ncbi:MAG TPA: NUDIX domain-containing protein [Candidatus Deferrimicrobium sp.]|nr:NUDIX domain-containing protein [Candidatus Deferrimicrobium sp.]
MTFNCPAFYSCCKERIIFTALIIKVREVFLTGEPVEFAAGGVVQVDTAEGVKIAVVQRSAYGDLTLPKGRYEEGDKSLLRCALREVEEEAGVMAEPLRYIDNISYVKAGLPKVVHFWLMHSGTTERVNKEKQGETVIWVSPIEAIKLLQHARERDIVSKAFNLSLNSRTSAGLSKYSLHNLLFGRGLRRCRLKNSIISFRTEVEPNLRIHATNSPALLHAQAVRELLTQSEIALSYRDLAFGWKCFHAAQRESLFLLSQTELNAKAIALLLEASSKLRSWRKDSIATILSIQCNGKTDASAEALHEAMLIRDEHSNNEYFKISLARVQFVILSTIMVAALGIFLLMVWKSPICEFLSGEIGSPSEASFRKAGGLLAAFLLGAIGATFSGLITTGKTQTKSRIPDLMSSFLITISRVILGSVSGVLVFLLLKSRLLSSLIDFSTSCYAIMILLCASGLNERWVVKAMNSVTERRD